MKKTKLTKRIITIVLSLIMAIGLLPLSAFAAEETPSYEVNDPAVDGNAASITVEVICETYYGTVTGGGSYNEGDTVTLTATPAEDMKFMYWLDATVQSDDNLAEEELKAAIVSYDAEYTFTATENVTLEAVFFAANEIPIVPMLITGTDDESLFAAEWVNDGGDFDTIVPGAEPLSLPGEIIEKIVTIEDTQYEFVGFIVFGYDEATDTTTVELKETMTIDAMPLYNSAEYWEWFTPLSDGVYVAYMEYTPEEDDGDEPQVPDDPDDPDEPQEPTEPGTPNEPQEPTEPEQPDDAQTPSSPQTGDNSLLALWLALLFISGGALIALTVVAGKRRITDRY